MKLFQVMLAESWPFLLLKFPFFQDEEQTAYCIKEIDGFEYDHFY
ncbi:MAG: hypothetical protein QRY74_06100 [Chlamydia sp.]